MSEFTACKRCKQYSFNAGNCKCETFWACDPADFRFQPEDDDWTQVYCRDVEDVAERFCEEQDNDSGEGLYVRNGGSDEIWVKDGYGNITKWEVAAEYDPVYYSNRHKSERDKPLPEGKASEI